MSSCLAYNFQVFRDLNLRELEERTESLSSVDLCVCVRVATIFPKVIIRQAGNVERLLEHEMRELD